MRGVVSCDAPPPKAVVAVPTQDLDWFREQFALAGDTVIVTDADMPEDFDG